MKKIIIIVIVIANIILFSCTYEDPFKEYDNKNLIARLDLTGDWVIDSGVQIDATDESPPSGYDKSYYFYFINLLDSKSSNFETSNNSNDTGNWIGSTDTSYSSSPLDFRVSTNPSGKLEGSKTLYIKLTNNPHSQYVYYEFIPSLTTNYTLKFDYYSPGATNIGISFGLSDNSQDNQIFNTLTSSNSVDFIVMSFSSIGSSPSQIRFGFKEDKNWESGGIDLYIDRIALFASSNHSIHKLLNIVESKDRTNDKTGEKFYEGVYKFTIYAKSHTSNILTLKLGGAIKEWTITNNWKKYEITSQILRTEGFLRLEILPTSASDSRKFPGGVFITKPELYFLYNQSTP